MRGASVNTGTTGGAGAAVQNFDRSVVGLAIMLPAASASAGGSQPLREARSDELVRAATW
jgi:hypothetical protein